MISFNQPLSLQVLDNHISVQVAAEYSDYSLQYLRRMLRISKLKGLKIGQMWLVEKSSLDECLLQAQTKTDNRLGPRPSLEPGT